VTLLSLTCTGTMSDPVNVFISTIDDDGNYEMLMLSNKNYLNEEQVEKFFYKGGFSDE